MRPFVRTLAMVVFTVALMVCGRPAQAQNDTAPLRLSDVLRIALQNSPRLRQAEARIERAAGEAQRTLAAFQRPTVNFTGSYTRLSSSNAQSSVTTTGAVQNPYSVGLTGSAPGSQPVSLSSSATGSSSSTASTATTTRARATEGTNGGEQVAPTGIDLSSFGFSTALHQRSVGVSLAQRIDITGLGRAYRSVSDAEKGIARQQWAQTRQEVIYNVTSAYYSALRDEALIRVSEAAVIQSEEQLRIAQIKFDQGAFARSDVLRAQTQLANNRQSLISARNQAVLSRSALANTMGVDPAMPITLAGDESTPLPALPDLNEEKLLADALAARPEAVEANLNQTKARGNVRIARQGQEPTVTASLTGNYTGNEGIALSRRATGTLGLFLSLPLSDGGATAGSVRIARADERIAAAQATEYRNGIRAEVTQAIVALRDAYDRVRNALPALEEAREGYRLSEARVRVGSATQLALYDAQTSLLQAEVNAINARYDYLTYLARLARATGGAIKEGL